jgi:hypothetical protein
MFKTIYPTITICLLCTLSAAVFAQTSDSAEFKDGAWVSYRDSYRKMISFEKYSGAKQFLQNNIRVAIIDKKSSLDGVKLSLESKKTHLNLPLDPVGRAVFPMLKAAYDENAELRVNRPDSVVKFEYRISITTRPDGIYDITDLHSACDQALHYARYQDFLKYSLKRCVGVKFVYAKDQSDINLRVKSNDRLSATLPVTDGSAYADDEFNAFKIATFKFADSIDKGQVTSNDVPLTLTALFE